MVNESLYLYDPDGNHLEISRDRSPEELRRQAGRAIPSRQLVNELLRVHQRDQEPWQGAHLQTRIGHLLVRVVDLQEAERFYRDVLGFDVTMRLPGATFVSAGGYHHHIGMATWQSAHGPQASLDVPGLRFFTIQLPDTQAEQAVAARLQQAHVPFARQSAGITCFDPSHNGIVLTYGPSRTLVLVNAQKQERWGHVLEILLLQALAYQMAHEEARALLALAQAVGLAEPEEYIRSFVDEGPSMVALLVRLREQQLKQGPTPYLNTILAAFPREERLHEGHPERENWSARHIPSQPLIDPLSERELDVLRLLARSLSSCRTLPTQVLSWFITTLIFAAAFCCAGLTPGEAATPCR